MANLEHIKPGAELVVSRAYVGFDLVKVDRVTATQIIVEAGLRVPLRINRKDGRVVGSNGFRARYAREADDKTREAIKTTERVNAARAALQGLKVTPENVAAVEGLLSGSLEWIAATAHSARQLVGRPTVADINTLDDLLEGIERRARGQ